MEIDTTTEYGQRVDRHLGNDRIIWLTTVGPDQTPQPSPVWFLWDNETVLIYSQPATPKLRNIEARPRVSLNFDGNGEGEDIVVLTGEAKIDPDAPPNNEVADYAEKYAEGIENLGMTADQFAQAYSVAVRIRPTALRGF